MGVCEGRVVDIQKQDKHNGCVSLLVWAWSFVVAHCMAKSTCPLLLTCRWRRSTRRCIWNLSFGMWSPMLTTTRLQNCWQRTSGILISRRTKRSYLFIQIPLLIRIQALWWYDQNTSGDHGSFSRLISLSTQSLLSFTKPFPEMSTTTWSGAAS